MNSTPEVNDENRGNVIEEAPIEPIAHINRLIQILSKLGLPSYLIVTGVLAAMFFQTWETPREKVRDEWRSCKMEFDNKCDHVGVRFETGYIELLLSEAVHGTPRVTTYEKLRGTYDGKGAP